MLKIKGKSYYNPKTQYIDPKFAKAYSGFIHWEASKGFINCKSVYFTYL